VDSILSSSVRSRSLTRRTLERISRNEKVFHHPIASTQHSRREYLNVGTRATENDEDNKHTTRENISRLRGPDQRGILAPSEVVEKHPEATDSSRPTQQSHKEGREQSRRRRGSAKEIFPYIRGEVREGRSPYCLNRFARKGPGEKKELGSGERKGGRLFIREYMRSASPLCGVSGMSMGGDRCVRGAGYLEKLSFEGWVFSSGIDCDSGEAQYKPGHQ